MEDEGEAFMPFLTMPSISAAIVLAALLRNKESDD
jgi:hypothetical protein